MINQQSSPIFQPLYRQIKSLITQSLETGEWRPGESIPSEMELAQRYQVSQGTVRKAVDELAMENILVRKQGKGTYVATHTEERWQYRFLRLQSANGVSNPQNRVLNFTKGKASSEVADFLKLKQNDPIFILQRVLTFSNEPVVLDEIILPVTQFKGLTLAQINAYKGSMYSFFETEFGITMIRAAERITALAATVQSAEVLDVPVKWPLLCVERVAYTYGDKPVEWRRGLYSTKNYYYVNELS